MVAKTTMTMTKRSVTKLITSLTTTEADKDIGNNVKHSNNIESSDNNYEEINNT